MWRPGAAGVRGDPAGGSGASGVGAGRLMLALHARMRVHLALGATDMRMSFDGLAAQVQTVLQADPFSGRLFRGKRGDLLEALWWDGQGLEVLAKRLEKGRFRWPTIARAGVVTLTTAQLAC